jgi:hypothetical protein
VTVWRVRIARWVPKATNTHVEYVILIAFPLQPRLKECNLMLRYTYSACLGMMWGHSFISRVVASHLPPAPVGVYLFADLLIKLPVAFRSVRVVGHALYTSRDLHAELSCC